MKRTFLLALILSVMAPFVVAQTTDSTLHAALLTCGPGDELYSRFGHSALRIYNDDGSLDYVYNYGTFDFNTPHFYSNFVMGNLNYMLSRYSYNEFLDEYSYEHRSVHAQPLNLTPQQCKNLFLMLEINNLPEYRYYRYNIISDNCATRLYDIVLSALGHDSLAFAPQMSLLTYRQYLHLALGSDMRWWQLGIDILLGATTDRRCNARQSSFFPEQLELLFENATIDKKPLTDGNHLVLSDSRDSHPAVIHPIVITLLLLVLAIVLTFVLKNHRNVLQWIDRVFYIIIGLVGVFLLFMWLLSSHTCCHINLNVLWLSPLFLLLAIRPYRSPKWAVGLQMGLVAVAIVITIIGIPQYINIACLPIMLLILVRLCDNLKNDVQY